MPNAIQVIAVRAVTRSKPLLTCTVLLMEGFCSRRSLDPEDFSPVNRSKRKTNPPKATASTRSSPNLGANRAAR